MQIITSVLTATGSVAILFRKMYGFGQDIGRRLSSAVINCIKTTNPKN